MQAWAVQEAIRKSFATHGSGSAPIVFKDEEGKHYEYTNVKADKNLVVVEIKRV